MTTKPGASLTQTATPVNGTERPTDWNSVNWRAANREVRRLRQRIFRASRIGDYRKVRSLQKLMLRSYSNRLTSVRRVTQTNKGRDTAGVDKVVVKTPAARGRFVDDLSAYRTWQARPAKRVYIPKANGKQRPLGIPVMHDRAIQAMVKNALEPEWESRFEGASYGFRPSRSAHDAREQIFSIANGNKKREWVLDADIKGAFDNISHEYLLNAIGQVPGRELIRQWLKAGYVELGTLHDTEAGTPQGGVISPLLANIALHGMEQVLGIKYETRRGRNPTRHEKSPALIRYADDFVVFCRTREGAEQAQECLIAWLAERGLTFSEEKTRIVHLSEGFDFLGWNVRRYKVPARRTGNILLIKPSKKAVANFRTKARAIWRHHRGHPVDAVIKDLNPVLQGWANYHRGAVATRTFHVLDEWMYERACLHVRFLHPNKPIKWRVPRYWGARNPNRPGQNWVFGLAGNHPFLRKLTWTTIQRHTSVRGTNSPDDPNLRDYWERRRKANIFRTPTQKWRHILTRQRGLCPLCGEEIILNDAESAITIVERTEEHHIRPRKQGGSDAWDNLEILHLYCHQQVTSNLRKQQIPDDNDEK